MSNQSEEGGGGAANVTASTTTAFSSTQALTAANLAAAAFVSFQVTIQLVLETVNPQLRLDRMQADIQELQRKILYSLPEPQDPTNRPSGRPY